MTSEASTSEPDNHPGKGRRLLVVGGAIAVVLVLASAVTTSVTMILALRSNIAILEEQARGAKKEAKALQLELADIRTSLAALEPEPEPAPVVAAAPMPAAAPVPPPPRPAATASFAPVRALKVQAVMPAPGTPIPVCVVRSGSRNDLVDCIKQRTRS